MFIRQLPLRKAGESRPRGTETRALASGSQPGTSLGRPRAAGAWSRFAVAEEKHRLVAYRWTDPGFHPGPSTHSVALDKSFDFLEPQFSVQWRRAGSPTGNTAPGPTFKKCAFLLLADDYHCYRK